MDPVELSVVVTVVESGAVLERCLDALAQQVDAPMLEVLVPWDPTVPDVPARVAGRAGVRAVALASAGPAAHEGERHALYDRRRAAGLAQASGRVVALLEDRSVPRPDWARSVLRAHDRADAGAVGGAVEPAVQGVLGWAVYFCDYGRYQLPFAAGPRAWVSDVNVSYARPALEATRPHWEDRYHESVVHWALQEQGRPLVLDPTVVVGHGRGSLGFAAGLSERFHWGRVFGYTRARTGSLAARTAHTLAAPVLPLVLWARLLGQRLQRRGRSLGPFLAATPAILLFLTAWCLGEAAGTATGRSA